MTKPKGKSRTGDRLLTEKTLLAALPKGVRDKLAGLNQRQRRFVVAYCGETKGNAKAAAELAGYASGHAAAVQGSWMLTRPDIRDAVEAWMAAFAMSAAELTARIADMAVISAAPFIQVSKSGTLQYKITAAGWERYAHWIKEFEVHAKTGVITRLVLHNPQAAQATLAKILKLFSDAPQITLNLYYEKMSDDELRAEIAAAQKAARSTAFLVPN